MLFDGRRAAPSLSLSVVVGLDQRVVLSFVLGLSVLFDWAPPVPAAGQAIELHQVRVYPFPDTLVVSGVSVLAPDTLVVWSTPQAVVVRSVAGRSDQVGQGTVRRPVAAALDHAGLTVEVVDADHREVLTFDRSGGIARRVSVPGVSRVLGGVLGPGGWYLITDADGSLELLALGARGGVRWARQVATSDSHYSAFPEVVLSAGPSEVLLSCVAPPHRSFRITESGEVFRFERIPNPGDLEPQEGLRQRWAALPVVSLADGYLQMVADLTSDRRRIAFFGSDLTVRDEAWIEVPIGFHHAVPGRDLIVAVTRIDQFEVRLYQSHRTNIETLAKGRPHETALDPTRDSDVALRCLDP